MQCVTPQQGNLPPDGPLRVSLRGWLAADMNPPGWYRLHLTEVAASRDRLVMSHRSLNKCAQKEMVQSFRVSSKITSDTDQLLWGLCGFILVWSASVVPASILSRGVALVSRDGKVQRPRPYSFFKFLLWNFPDTYKSREYGITSIITMISVLPNCSSMPQLSPPASL